MISIVQRSPRMSIARPTEQKSGRSSSYMNVNGSGSAAEGAPAFSRVSPRMPHGILARQPQNAARLSRASAAECRKLPGEPNRVVVGEQEAGSLEHAQLRVGQQVERLLGDRERVHRVLVGPQQQRRNLD